MKDTLKIFITGATGFIGRNLSKRLAENGHDVICGGRSLDRLKELSGKVKAAYTELEDKEAIRGLLRRERPEVLFHCAALVESHSLKKLRRINVEGTRNVLDVCMAEGVGRVIYLSSIAVVSGNTQVPLTEDLPYKATGAYGQSKLEAEKIALDYRKKGLKIAILRPCMVYGEHEPHGLPRLIEALKKRLFPILGRGENKIHLVSVENVVDAMTLCLSKEEAYGGSYFIADKEVLTMKELLVYITWILGVKPPIAVPRCAAVLLARLPFIGEKISFFLKDRVYSIKRLERELGYVPRISVYDGLKKSVLSYIDKQKTIRD
ncbi:MAG: hypothetical protein A2Z72_04745 [Omnitrophica bacterium RBG_13_46_9]|nr:MAG: hypothetical protein A2Z72_04745 [Omnitrophica bacterium RBG_13_46_9]